MSVTPIRPCESNLDEIADYTPAPTARDVGRRIRQLRTARGLTQADVAAAFDLEGHHRLSYWERGVNLPSSEYLIGLAEILGVSIDYLLTGRAAGDHDLPVPERTPIPSRLRSDFHRGLASQIAKGRRTPGGIATTWNGRDAGQDALEAWLGLGTYLTQLRAEYADLIVENARLRAELAERRGQP